MKVGERAKDVAKPTELKGTNENRKSKASAVVVVQNVRLQCFYVHAGTTIVVLSTTVPLKSAS